MVMEYPYPFMVLLFLFEKAKLFIYQYTNWYTKKRDGI